MAHLKDLIDKCEESEIFTQNLQDNVLKLEIKGKSGFVTFATDPKIIDEWGKQKIGIVIWFPTDIFER